MIMANLGYIQVIRSCNQKCLFCSNPDNEQIKDIKSVYENIDKLIDLGYDGIILTGGEPTLYPYLIDAIKYAKQKGIDVRLITNGQRICDINYLKELKAAGLKLIHISLYSYKPSIQDYLTQTKDSLRNILRSLKNAIVLGVDVNINTVINAYNANHLDKTVMFLTKRFPQIKHFVWNNLDPNMNRASQNLHTISSLVKFEKSLYRAMRYLDHFNKTFRIERVPLCYLQEYAWVSTEARKIVKNEERIVYFLDEKGAVRQKDWQKSLAKPNSLYKKNLTCTKCILGNICPGLYSGGKYYSLQELKAVSDEQLKDAIIKKIL